MPPPDDTYRNIPRLNRLFAATAVLLAGALVWLVCHDHYRPWRKTQQAGQAADSSVSQTLRSLPLLQFINPPQRIRQLVLPDILTDRSFVQTETIDRCTTCHVNIDRPQSAPQAKSPAHLPHPNLALYVGEDSPHPMERFGCTSCHDGAGAETDFTLTGHGEEDGNRPDIRPIRPKRYVQANCARCHNHIDDIRDEAPRLASGRAMFTQLGCTNCHAMEGLPPADLTTKVGPDLRHIADKTSAPWLETWVWSPRQYRPSARMPQVFNLENNSTDEEIRRTRQEVRAIVAYLLKTSTSAAPPSMPAVSDEPQRVRERIDCGRVIFMGLDERGQAVADRQGGVGCIGCHVNLNETGKQWTAADLQSRAGLSRAEAASQYAAMPFPQRQSYALDHFADPLLSPGISRFPDGRVRPVFPRHGPELSDIGGKLLAGARSKTEARLWLYNWLTDPSRHAQTTRMPSPRLRDSEAIELAEYLLAQRGRKETVGEYTHPTALNIPADASDLAPLGQRLILHYGCMNCHAINDMESVPSPFPDLSNWGDKPADKLDFGLLLRPGLSPPPALRPTRTSWIEHKLANPRLYDRGRQIKPYEKLRMPSFSLDDERMQSLVTFVTSSRPRLVSPKMLEQANTDAARRIALGRQIAIKYNCIGCHQFNREQPPIQQYWALKLFDPADLLGKAPPTLRGEGARIQHAWLFNFLKNPAREGVGSPSRIRPQPFIRMPAFSLTDAEATALVAYFAAESGKESYSLRKLTQPLIKGGWPDGQWFTDPKFSRSAQALKTWSLATARLKPAEFSPRNTPADLATTWKSAIFDARFIADLYDATYPFADVPRPAITEERFAKGEKFFQFLGCNRCHVLGDETNPRVLPHPRGPNLALAQRRIRRDWARRWIQETQVVLPSAIMPPFFTGRAVANTDGEILFKLHGLPFAPSPPSPEKIRAIQAEFGQSADDQTNLLLDFLYAAPLRGHTSLDPLSTSH